MPNDYSEEERAKVYRAAAFDESCPKSFAITEILELIRKLKEKGAFLAVVSSDLPETLLLEVREWDLENIFNEIVTGADDKLKAVQKLIRENSLNLEDTFFVGDSNHEIDVAKSTGIKSIAVTWGFTSERKLRARNPDYIAHNAEELERAIFAQSKLLPGNVT